MGSSPSTLSIIGVFTKNGGEPATGLTLSEVTFRLVRIGKTGSDEETVWTSQVAEGEVIDGTYFARYSDALLDDFSYFSVASYSGAVTLDSDNFSRRYE